MKLAKSLVALFLALCVPIPSVIAAELNQDAAATSAAAPASDAAAKDDSHKSPLSSFLKIAPRDPNGKDPVLDVLHKGLSIGTDRATDKQERHGSAANFTETDYHGWQINNGEVKISCVDPHAACGESEHVLNTLKILFKAYSKGDYETAGKYMDEGCTTFDETTKTMIVGKEAVLKDLKSRIDNWENSDSPLLSYTLEHPYAKVTGDIAVVSFVAVKVFGGKHPQRFESHCTDIFKKEQGKWKKLHYRSNWKEVSAT